MKVYTQTWYRGNNYGSVLQAYALSEVIQSMGYECAVLGYAPDRWTNWKLKFLHNGFRSTIEYKINEFAMKRAGQANEQVVDNMALFDTFRKEQMQITPACYNAHTICQVCGKDAVFVCGSDQIWNPYHFNSCYFLDFVKDSNCKIAYGPSFGVENLPVHSHKSIARQLSTFTYLSVREKQGAEIISKLTGQKAQVVADPTALLPMERWDYLASSSAQQESPYLFCYFLSKNPEYFRFVRELADRWGLRLRILPMVASDFQRPETIKEPVGPCQWLDLVKHADWVLTDSFHCTLFAIRYHRQFHVLQRFAAGDKRGQNSRIQTLLETTDFLERLLIPGEKGRFDKIQTEQFALADEKIQREADKSLQWLIKALHQATGGKLHD